VLERLRLAAWWNGRHSRLKICFWETGVPVRIRPRPPEPLRDGHFSLPYRRSRIGAKRDPLPW
jgi:hypothetical protein